MGEMHSAALALKHQIEEAFSSIQYPGDDNIVEKDFPEYIDVAKRFGGKDWRIWKDNPGELLMDTVGDISFFSPQAFCYYLPLYMLNELFIPSDYPFYGEVIGSLAPSSVSEVDNVVNRRLACMNRAQLRAVLEFLAFMKNKIHNPTAYPLADAIANVSSALTKQQ